MRQRSYTGPKLPKQLLDKVDSSGTNGRKRKLGHDGPEGRRERRKAERAEKKAQRIHTQQKPTWQSSIREGVPSSNGAQNSIPPFKATSRSNNGVSQPPKSILKRTSQFDKSLPLDKNTISHSTSQHIPRKEKERLSRDEEEIAALEKKLGLKGTKKLPKSLENDGLESLLGGLDDDSGRSVKRKRVVDAEWLKSKRRKASHRSPGVKEDEDRLEESGDGEQSLSEEDDLDGYGESLSADSGDEGHEDGWTDSDSSVDEGDVEDAFEGFESDASQRLPQMRTRENPYIPPVSENAVPTAKYIPPSRRAPATSDAESMARLRRQSQGLLNRLSEANLISIVQEMEKLYQSYPRGYVTSTLIDLLLGLTSDRTSLLDTFLILHAGFIAAVYKVIGQDFGAQLIERLVEEIDKHYTTSDLKEATGKQAINLISLLAELYNFQVVGSNLMFDYIRLFLHSLSELNTELLLKIIRTSGPQLRSDDPTALKSIVLALQNLVSEVDHTALSVRTKFMLETITNLKNNRMRTGAAASAIVSEHTVRMKKTLGSLNTRSLKATEPLRIGLADLRSKDKRGKWWVIGASFRDPNNDDQPSAPLQSGDNPAHTTPSANGSTEVEPLDTTTPDLHTLALKNRMNTPIRLAIFMSIMSATDYKDAHLRLLKLHLKRAQELEIPRVLLHCAGMETGYNPYYTLIARKLCGDRRLRMGFQFGLWDLFRRMGESGDGDGDGGQDDQGEDGWGEDVGMRKIVNLARLYGNLIVEDALSITVLKILPFPYLQPKTSTFLELLLITIILQSQKKSSSGPSPSPAQRNEKCLLDIIMKVRDAPQMARGLQYFLKKVVSRTDLAGGKTEREIVRWGCEVAVDALETIAANEVVVEE